MDARTSKLIDEYAALDEAIAKMKPHIERHKALRDELAAISSKGAAPQEALTLENDRYVLTWTPCEQQRRIVDMTKVKKLLGIALFTRLATITLKALDSHVTEAQQREFALTVTERTGPRTCRVIPKLIPVVKQAS